MIESMDEGGLSFAAMHAVIASGLREIAEMARDYHHALLRFQDMDELLLNYFGCQNEEFYHTLKHCCSGCRADLMMIDFLSRDIADLKIEFLTFQEKYTRDAHAVRIRNFPKDFQTFSNRIFERISIETAYLLPILHKKKSIAQ